MEGADRSLIPQQPEYKSSGMPEYEAVELPRLVDVLPKSFIDGVVSGDKSYLRRDYSRFGDLTVGNFEAEEFMTQMVVECVKYGEWKPIALSAYDSESLVSDFKTLEAKAGEYQAEYGYTRDEAVDSTLSSETSNNFRYDYKARHVLNMIAPRHVPDYARNVEEEDDKYRTVSWAVLNPENFTLEFTPYAIEEIAKKADYWERSKSKKEKVVHRFSQIMDRALGRKM